MGGPIMLKLNGPPGPLMPGLIKTPSFCSITYIASFPMLYTGNFALRYHIGFLRIRSRISGSNNDWIIYIVEHSILTSFRNLIGVESQNYNWNQGRC